MLTKQLNSPKKRIIVNIDLTNQNNRGNTAEATHSHSLKKARFVIFT